MRALMLVALIVLVLCAFRDRLVSPPPPTSCPCDCQPGIQPGDRLEIRDVPEDPYTPGRGVR